MYQKSSSQQYSFFIDLQWCLGELLQANIISEKDKILVQTSHRNKESMAWHPLQWIAQFKLKHCQTQDVLTLDVLTAWLSKRSQMPLFTIDPLNSDMAALTQSMSEEFALRNNILAVGTEDDYVLVGTDQPFFSEWVENLEQSIRPRRVKPVLLNPEHLKRYLVEYYRVSRAVTFSEKNQSNDVRTESVLEIGDIQNPDANDQHIVKLVDWILQFAFEQGASDIHLEPRPDKSKVRFRIDGILHTIYHMPVSTLGAVIARMKILGRMNVAEKRKPQDGRIKTRTPKGIETELRLATLPTAFGEKIVLRIFDPEVLVRNFEQLGFDPHLLSQWNTLTQHSHGIILVTGPTGSGKTTTLYSSLKQLAQDSVNVCSIEDPIEMLEGSFNQMQVNPTIELGFAEGIRAMMRQDPDIMMVGEIRDRETADMAIQAALTGHLVLSTLHTNDAPSSLMRLHDLGIQPFLSAATLLGVLAQRLVRTLCRCKQEVTVNQEMWQQLAVGYDIECPTNIYQAKGCKICRYTGYKGRIGIYEFMPVSLKLKQLIGDDASLIEIKQQAKSDGVEPLRIAGIRKVIAGATSMEEVLRVVPLSS